MSELLPSTSTQHRLKNRYKLDINTHIPHVPYLETITGTSEAHHRHKKQTGGRGQFADVNLRVRPLPRGEGFKFVDAVKGGVIPNQYIPAVEKGVREQIEKGVVSGNPVVDTEVEVFFGGYHPVDEARNRPSRPRRRRPSASPSSRRAPSCSSRSSPSRSPCRP